ncbi:MAG TPA: AbrB/MazE/SpoVT family DNA-binding domain-containing protein [Vitreimonas sp.]|uniref:AbrB/MazE/SpoVT family DNA-binding domain-containing protein n=1 Tax=Vitreimonas sp. TaxID=3069702 RepID=UPI002D75D554|nr:AbrB/MazE/SpoVT family DNA-binding domain-containing protein [Vitreimonas sp.]HYD87885.1 AbrB/MazE/SpoVT family DNA-binding domain-containing protein [Vitreimonas sp.]
MTDNTEKPKGVSEAQSPSFQAQAPTKPVGRTLKVRKIGNSLGVVLPKDVLAKLRVGEGDELTVSDTPNGVALQPHDAELQEQIEAARRAMKRYRNALRELAK